MDAVLLTGGRAQRLGGADKPALAVGGVSMVARVVDAVAAAGAERIVVVGPDPGIPGVAAVTREDPPGSGPVAAIGAALPHLGSDQVAVLATDLPFVTAAAVTALRTALAADPSAAAALAVDADGRDQLLLAVWRTAALRSSLAGLGPLAGLPVRALAAAAPGPVLRVADLGPSTGPAPPWFDCDTPTDLARARALAAQETPMPPLDDWMDAVIADLGLAAVIDRDEARTLMLDLARDVAHGVERPAAPVTTFLAGLAAGRAADPRAATAEVAERIAALLRSRAPG